MVTKEQETPIIRIGRVTNIKYEPLEDFRKSVSFGAYKKAFEMTNEIIQENRAYHNNSSDIDERGGTIIRNTEQIYNIIFFTGERGTGKTSIMLSYMEFLKDYYKTRYRKENALGEMIFQNDNLMFTGLEYIDASVLSNKEDILGSVLAKMLKKWESEERINNSNKTRGITREEDYSYKKRQIQRRFKDVYQYLKNLQSDKNLIEDDSDLFIETLDNMAMTWNLKQAFQQLVFDYLDIMEYPGSAGTIARKNHFLVVSIDDLDLNIDHGFQLLEQVRTYLMIPNIIVLLSANYEQLEKLCNNYYSIKFKGIQGEQDTKSYISRMSREYLEKMVPIQRQVVLYSGTKWAFFRNEAVCFIPEDEDGVKDEAETIEKLVKSNMKQYLGMETSLGNSILYYLAPHTLRELISWELQMKERNNISSDIIKDLSIEEKEQHYDANIKWFWNTYFPTLMKKYIGTTEESIFATLDMLEPTAQMRFLRAKLLQSNETTPQIKTDSLLELLCEKKQGSIEAQKLPSLILIYFSAKISEILTRMTWLTESKRVEQVNNLLKYYNGGVWGSWEREMIRSFFGTKDTPHKSTFKIGYARFKKSSNAFDIDIPGSAFEKATNEQKFKELINKNREFLINYQYLLLFYTLDGADGACEWEVKDGKSLQVRGNHSGLFCLSNIILNTLEKPELVEQFLDALPTVFCSAEIPPEVKEAVISSISILHLNEKWFKKPLLPFGNLDFLIDLGMQIQQNIGNGIPNSINQKTMTPYIIRFFDIISSRLSEYEEYKTFSEFPPIAKILKNDEDFMEILSTSIMSIAELASESDDME